MRRNMTIGSWAIASLAILGSGVGAQAQTLPAPAASPEMAGIWGAMAYSPAEAEHGFFWGADTLAEAREEALEHCASMGGRACEIVTEFRNYRHYEEDDETGFPYEPCGALATAGAGEAWGAASASTAASAREQAMLACKDPGADCRVVEWVCT